MTLRSPLQFLLSIVSSLHRPMRFLPLMAALAGTPACLPQTKPAPKPEPDVLVLSNGDTLHGKLVSESDGKVTFHCDPLGDVTLGWDKIKEVDTSQKFAVIDKHVKLRRRTDAAGTPIGTIQVAKQAVIVHSESARPLAPVPVKDAQYILDEATFDRHLDREPGWFAGWNGTSTAGATVVTSTQNQYTVSGSVSLVRIAPTVNWLLRHDRTSVDLSGSYGKITQPGYYAPATAPGAGETYVPESVTKTGIYHADAERDEYLSARLFVLGQTAFDHNSGQNLDLQQIYGGGFGWTVLKTPRQEADLKASIQYEKQEFMGDTAASNQNLVGSTFAASYLLHFKKLQYTQSLAFVPAYNQPRAYSVNETDTLAFPAHKNLGFSVGTTDSYLNDPPLSLPPTKRNSFQFTMGLTYTLKSKD